MLILVDYCFFLIWTPEKVVGNPKDPNRIFISKCLFLSMWYCKWKSISYTEHPKHTVHLINLQWPKVPSCLQALIVTFSSLLCLEQQPRLRGWLLASLDGQTTGLVPANYVKVLGKRRGRKHTEMERLAQVQQENTQASQTALAAHPQSHPAQGFIPSLGSASAAASSEELLESVYRETPASFTLGVSSSNMPSSTVLNIPEKTDLWCLCMCAYLCMQVWVLLALVASVSTYV